MRRFTSKMVQAVRKAPLAAGWEPSPEKSEFLSLYVLQASPAGATLAGWVMYA
jgi:hypothetical protein